MASPTETAAQVRAPLSRERVLRAAVALVDDSGLKSLTMRRLGEAVGVEAMSLYNHVAGKDDLLDGMVDLVFSEIDLPSGGPDWKAAMRRQRAISAREALARHPWGIGLMESRTSPGPATLRHHDAVIGILRRGASPSSWPPMRSPPSTATSTGLRSRRPACRSTRRRRRPRWPRRSWRSSPPTSTPTSPS